jgi:AcrR family transcriptional regulator
MHAQSKKPPRRRYRMARRLDSVEETRRRITAAAFDLHATIGPSRTTIKAIAERAGVQRHTVYAHFPDLETLYAACTAHGIRATSMPEAAPWVRIADPVERLGHGLRDLYAWYRANERMLLNVLHDGGAEAADAAAVAPEPDAFDLRMGTLRAALAAGWDVPDPASRRYLDAALTHALGFETWRSLTMAGLDDDAAIDLVAAVVRGLADGAIRPG